jgi:hypothetical protein
MAKHYSAYFKRSHKDFVAKGVFDGFVGKDARLHVDPLLLKRCKTPEFVGAYEKLLDHFRKLLTLVPEKDKQITNLRYKSIVQHLSFPEFHFIGLGFGDNSRAGKGITGKKAELLAETAIEIVQDGVEDPEIFLLVNLFQEKIGADGISDIMIWTLRNEFVRYTQRVTEEFGFKTYKFDGLYNLPFFIRSDKKRGLVKTPIIFVPTEIIRNLPEAEYRDGHFFSDYNNEIRRRISKDVGLALRDMRDKKLLKQRLLAKPAVMSKMAEIYRHLKGKSYDFMQDDSFIYASAIIEELIGQEPLPLEAKEDNLEAVMYIARQICLQFKKMVETNRMSELLYNKDKFKNEKALQRLFLLMADGYCNISDIVLSPETDYGAGPVDFKFSSGYHSKVLLEMKLARNSQLMHGIEVQLPTYLKAESTSKGIYMIVIANDHDEKLVNALWKRMKAQNIPESLTQNIIVIDARKRNSASRL